MTVWSKRKGKKWRQPLDFTVLQLRTHQSCFVSYTAVPYLDCCFSSHPLLKCLAQLCPLWFPALSAISHIPNPNTLSQSNYGAGTTPTSILYQQFPLVCFTGNDVVKNAFGLERLVQHQPTIWSWQVAFPWLLENRHKYDLGMIFHAVLKWPHLGPVPAATAPRVPLLQLPTCNKTWQTRPAFPLPQDTSNHTAAP